MNGVASSFRWSCSLPLKHPMSSQQSGNHFLRSSMLFILFLLEAKGEFLPAQVFPS